jgi:hypothetical protein
MTITGKLAKQKIALHIYESNADYSAGKRLVISEDWRDNPACMRNRLWLGSTEVEIDFPEKDTHRAHIDSLEARIKQERADSQVRVNMLLDRISKLQAIGHDG